MGKKLNWITATLLLIPLAFIIYAILIINIPNAKILVAALVIMSFGEFYYERKNDDYFTLTLFSYYVVGIFGAVVIVVTGWVWMLLLVIVALRYVKMYTSRANEHGEEIYEALEQEEEGRKGLQNFISAPLARKEKGKYIIDFFIYISVLGLLLYAYQSLNENYGESSATSTEVQK